MQSLVFVLVAALVTCRAANVNRHLKLLNDNNIQSKEASLSKHNTTSNFVTISRRPSDVYLHRPGTNLELTCEALGSPAPSVRWFKNDAPVYEHDLESNEIIDTNPSSLARVTSTLLIPRTESQDEYTCVISAGPKTAMASATVYSDGSTEVTERGKLTPLIPQILTRYKFFLDIMGSNIILPCKVRGHPRPHVTWINNKGIAVKKNSDSRMKVLRSGELVISGLTWSDMGEFTCRAKNAFGIVQAATFVYPAKAG